MDGVEVQDWIAKDKEAGAKPDFETIQPPSVVEPRQIPPEPPIPQLDHSEVHEASDAGQDGAAHASETTDVSNASTPKTPVLRAADDVDNPADGQADERTGERDESDNLESDNPESEDSESGDSKSGRSEPDESGDVETCGRLEHPDDVPQEIQTHRVVEAILFAADAPLPPAKIAGVLGVGDARDVRKHIERLNEEYAAHGLSFRVEHVAGGYQMLTLPAYNTWLRKLLRARRETRLSSAALETLAVVAYKQPCTRAEIEAVRGVAAGDLLNRLREMNLVKIVGRAEDLGRPLLYGTTRHFLEVFGLPSLEDLPQVEALSQPKGPAGSPADRAAQGAEMRERPATASQAEAGLDQALLLRESLHLAIDDSCSASAEREAANAPVEPEASDTPIEREASDTSVERES